MEVQTALLDDMAQDLSTTRKFVEQDAAERKFDMLQNIQESLDDGFTRIENRLETQNGYAK
jgi:hypothetical protein